MGNSKIQATQVAKRFIDIKKITLHHISDMSAVTTSNLLIICYIKTGWPSSA